MPYSADHLAKTIDDFTRRQLHARFNPLNDAINTLLNEAVRHGYLAAHKHWKAKVDRTRRAIKAVEEENAYLKRTHAEAAGLIRDAAKHPS